MSAHSAAHDHAHDTASHASHGAEASDHDPWADGDDHDDGHHAEPPPPEPESPVWLPILGGAIFLLVLIGYLLVRQEEPSAGVQGDVGAEAAEDAGRPAPAAPRNAPANAADH